MQFRNRVIVESSNIDEFSECVKKSKNGYMRLSVEESNNNTYISMMLDSYNLDKSEGRLFIDLPKKEAIQFAKGILLLIEGMD